MSSPMGQGVNSSIASGSAFGSGDSGGPGTVTSIFDVLGGVSKVGLKGEEGTSLFTGELLGGTASGLGGLKETGIFSKIIDAIFAGADAKEAFSAFAGSGGGDGDSGGDAGDSGESTPFSALEGVGLDGMMGGTSVDHSQLGALSPSATPGIGRSEGIGMF